LALRARRRQAAAAAPAARPRGRLCARSSANWRHGHAPLPPPRAAQITETRIAALVPFVSKPAAPLRCVGPWRRARCPRRRPDDARARQRAASCSLSTY
jgi:hypothetical protein